MTSPNKKNVRFVSSNYPEKQPCWGTKRSAWTSDEEAPSSTPHSSSMNAKMSSSSLSSSRRSHSFYQRILFPPKRQELFVYELPECLFIHNEEKISERSEEFDMSNDEDKATVKTTKTTKMTRMERIRNSANSANNAPTLNSILKKSQCDIHQSHQAILSGTPQQLQTSKSKSKSLFKKNKNKNKNKKNVVPIPRRVSDISSSEHTDSSSISSSSSICIDKTSTSLSRSHRDSFSDLQKLLVAQRSGLKKGEDSNTTSTSSLSTTDLEYDDTTTEEATDDCDYRRVVHLEKQILAIIHK
ncbi:hypothetical protein FRACYDRAFT_253502 [Fragilariopsis cylindrus CCMP1102]|uniref:Uncharacterized protein n=1 Tax=Fragilariopsis cylindrus CCMP1102 TaxID=635003 RepID=A0A1E7ELE4_9STRA|nr:hypothetical protein FRACYDRAFT_253502 [Fragilariopsis cylindrus CCMP1102]|eukprot:OEU06740.1 hypothetical protein FRACYDRAFT_253502 [Fragilariopsis cylindrus CCMP1102]